MKYNSLVEQVVAWARGEDNIRGVCVVGSHARGNARFDSDVDLVILCSKPSLLLNDGKWRAQFGAIEKSGLEDWGALKSLRTFYQGLEVEFGVAATSWAAIPVDEGTREVVLGGLKVLYDPDELLAKLVRAVVS